MDNGAPLRLLQARAETRQRALHAQNRGPVRDRPNGKCGTNKMSYQVFVVQPLFESRELLKGEFAHRTVTCGVLMFVPLGCQLHCLSEVDGRTPAQVTPRLRAIQLKRGALMKRFGWHVLNRTRSPRFQNCPRATIHS